MPTVSLKSATFDALEAAYATPDVTWAYADEVDLLTYASPFGKATVLQLSSTLIRVEQQVSAHPRTADIEIRLSGSGIGPVSNLDALLSAIDNGLAIGNLSKLEILENDVLVLTVAMDAAGYHLISGDLDLSLTGTLPLTLTQFTAIADLFQRVAEIDTLSSDDRAALFADLTAYAVTGLSLTDGGRVLFAAHVNATEISLTVTGLTLTAKGSFPANLGQDIEALWNMLGSGDPLHVTGFGDATVTSVTLRDAAGKLLGTVADPLADTPIVTRVDGKIYDHIDSGENGDDVVTGYFRDRMMLAGLDGRDTLIGGNKIDHLMGGLGNDVLIGNGGNDRLDGGRGRDVLTGGTGADVFHFDLGDGTDHIIGFKAREDIIEILDATRKSDLTMTQVGADVQIDFRTIHIVVEDVLLAQVNQVINFDF